MIKENSKKIILVAMLVIIAGSVWYLEGIKAKPGNNVNSAPTLLNAPEQGAPVKNSSAYSSASILSISDIAAKDKKSGYHPAVEIAEPTGFINATSSFLLSGLAHKKVVLLDFWTYSCINCIRVIPHLNAWYEKYHDAGLEIVGIHTPEFEFEKDYANVAAAVKNFAIKYPVVLDSNHRTWDAYRNQYWPHEYLIDMAGYIVHDVIGEGSYDETEAEIQKLLAERAEVLGIGMQVAKTGVTAPQDVLSGIDSPETYFGAARNDYLANGVPHESGLQTLARPQAESLNELYLTGDWNFDDEFATNMKAGARIIYRYRSSKVFFVGSAPAGATIEVLQDGVPVSAANAGGDVHNGKIIIKESRLYNVINNRGTCSQDGVCSPEPGEHTIELIIDSPGLNAYTFTFG